MRHSVEELSLSIQWGRDQFLQMDHGVYGSHIKLYRKSIYHLSKYPVFRVLAPIEEVLELDTAILKSNQNHRSKIETIQLQ